MTAYLVFIGLITLLLSADYFQRRNGYGPLTGIALVLTAGFIVFRYETGYDYLNYVEFYQADIAFLVQKRMEWGFIGIVWLLKGLHADYFWMFFFFGIGILGFLFHGIKLYTNHVRIAFLIYLLIPGLFLNSFSIIRQSLAVVILFNAYFYYYSNRYKTFGVLCLLGILFHYSALFVIPFFFLAKRLHAKARSLIWIGIPLSLLMARLHVMDIAFTHLLGNTRFLFYADFQDGGASFAKLLILNFSILPYLFFYRRMSRVDRSLLVLVTTGVMLLNICADISAITRIAYYFKIFEIVLLANLVSQFGKMPSRLLACTGIFAYYFIMFYGSLSYDYRLTTTYPKITPYQTIFQRRE